MFARPVAEQLNAPSTIMCFGYLSAIERHDQENPDCRGQSPPASDGASANRMKPESNDAAES